MILEDTEQIETSHLPLRIRQSTKYASLRAESEDNGIQLDLGSMTLEDMAGYQAKKREALCAPYRDWQICGMPPPTSGGVAVLQTMGILARFDLSATLPGAPEGLHLVAEASRLAFADRGRHLADSDFVPVPLERLLDSSYLGRRAAPNACSSTRTRRL